MTKNEDLCPIYCPSCDEVTDKISLYLLKNVINAEVTCPVCCNITILEYDGEKVSIWHHIA